MILCFLLLMRESNGQIHLISDGNFSVCSGFLTDTGGDTATYGPQENFFCTLSAGASSSVGVRMIVNSIQPGDTLRIYDGLDAFSPLLAAISDGNYLGYSFSPENPQHALTFHFQSNSDTLSGKFRFTIACNNCPNVKPLINAGESEIHACVGDTILLNGSASILGVGGVSQAYWTADDGGVFSSDWPSISRVFNNPGMYYVGLNFQNTMGCSGVFPAYVQIRISNPPAMALTATDSTVCIGQPIVFDLQTDTSEWSPTTAGTGGQIPDLSNLLLSINVAGSGTIQSESDINDVTAVLEHSYMADLKISLVCPNGQQIVLKDSGTGGGNWLGTPVDNTDGTPGTGAAYTWSPTVTSPVMGDANCVYQAVTGGGQSLVPGEYASSSPWAGLIGCPVNGTWSLDFQDVAAADDGWVSSWSISINGMFEGELYHAFQTLVPPSCSNVDWEGPFDFITNGDCQGSLIYPYAGGAFLIQATARNNFGCASSAGQLIQVSASFDAVVNITEPTLQLGGSASLLFTYGEGDHFISWSTGETGVNGISDLAPGNYSVLIADTAGCSTSIPFIIESPLSVAIPSQEDFYCFYNHSEKALIYRVPMRNSSTWSFKVFDQSGKLVHAFRAEAPASGKESIPTLSSGVYLAECINGAQRTTLRFVVN